ncbi:twin-arginine translocation pathway signal [Arsukibacterium sp. MJ3]|jgi:hypothetical protein|uniref:DUF1569 domain-containing protein n=1 Tax=Arsukibacterium sp. MJ3 TaxID=1632859 RepID=UPI000626F74B|nr:DUF1569 domain-containing protein [Arsukibacterium sp. MJ3]KKO48665.1 twin-arginine translocation pathway signal [Arsukibacterium sp. MJ3]
MNRRQFLQASVLAPVAIVLVTKLVATIRPYPLSGILLQLRALPPQRLSSSGEWNVSQILQHCAQSVRYSIDGYPKARSLWFQNSIGKLAINAFAATGKLHHPLNEPIPGAPTLAPELPNDVALRELIYTVQQFMDWQGELQPHFTYGSLSKAQYYSVHYLHLQSHLDQISVS